MPVAVRKGDADCPWEIYNVQTGEREGCSDTQAAAEASARARNAAMDGQMMDRDAIPLRILTDAPTGAELGAEHPTSRIQVAKTGSFKDSRYGAFKITAADFAQWIKNFSEVSGGRVPVDFDHSPEKRGTTEAAGWITNLQAESGTEGETLWATVEWTSLGAEAVRDRRYQFISPSYVEEYRSDTGKKRGATLIGVALTNRPFLEGMAAVSLSRESSTQTITLAIVRTPWDGSASRFTDEQYERSCVVDRGGSAPPKTRCSLPILEPNGDLNVNAVHAAAARINQVKAPPDVIATAKRRLQAAYGQIGEKPPTSLDASDSRPQMPELTNIAKALGLEEEADEAKILEAIQGRPLLKVADALELTEEADEAKILEKIAGLQKRIKDAEAGQLTRPLGEIAREKGKVILEKADHEELVRGFEQGKQAIVQLHEKRFSEAFHAAVAEGRAAPASEDRFRSLYEADEATTLDMLDELPRLVSTEAAGSGHAGEAPAGQEPERYLLDRRVRAHMRKHNETDYQKALDAVLAEDEVL